MADCDVGSLTGKRGAAHRDTGLGYGLRAGGDAADRHDVVVVSPSHYGCTAECGHVVVDAQDDLRPTEGAGDDVVVAIGNTGLAERSGYSGVIGVTGPAGASRTTEGGDVVASATDCVGGSRIEDTDRQRAVALCGLGLRPCSGLVTDTDGVMPLSTIMPLSVVRAFSTGLSLVGPCLLALFASRSLTVPPGVRVRGS